MFDIDRYLNPFVPAPRLDRLPPKVSRWFGYRSPDDDSLTDTVTPVLTRPYGYWITNLCIMTNTFLGLLATVSLCKFAPAFKDRNTPYIPSWAASSILVFNALRAPLAQPRNVLFGTFLSSLVGVIVSKLFCLSNDGENHLYIASALSPAIASSLMFITKTVHPPAGAAAMLPCIDDEVRALGWYYLAVQLAISAVFMTVTQIVNNVLLVYPMYWWTPVTLKPKQLPPPTDTESLESYAPTLATNSEDGGPIRVSRTRTNEQVGDGRLEIIIRPDHVYLPPLLTLSADQLQLIEELQLALNTVNVVSPSELGEGPLDLHNVQGSI